MWHKLGLTSTISKIEKICMSFSFIEKIGGFTCWIIKGCKSKYSEERSLFYFTRNLIVGLIITTVFIGILCIFKGWVFT